MLSFVESQNLDLENELKEVCGLLQTVIDKLSGKIETQSEPDAKLLKYRVWCKGLEASLKELYASYEAALFYRHKINAVIMNDMSEEEKKWYAIYVYFDKNGFIRVFSLLDKLGTFLNEYLELKTEQVKSHYSFFTVLRTLRERQIHLQLTLPLNEVKEASKESTFRLRKRRNTEVHYMNSEMEDDLIQETRMFGHDVKLENLDQQVHDLYVGLKMNIMAIKLTFQYADKQILR